MPARTRARIRSGDDVDGPSVQTIFARRLTPLIVRRTAPIQETRDTTGPTARPPRRAPATVTGVATSRGEADAGRVRADDGPRLQPQGSDGADGTAGPAPERHRPTGPGTADRDTAGAGPWRIPHGLDVAAGLAWRVLLIAAALYVVIYLAGTFSVVLVPVVLALIVASLLAPEAHLMSRKV